MSGDTSDTHALLADLLENDNWSRNSDHLAGEILKLVEPPIRADERQQFALALRHTCACQPCKAFVAELLGDAP